MGHDFEEIEEGWSEAYHEILDVLYEEATPGLDYASLEPGELADQHPPTYRRHFLDGERQEELIEDTLDDYAVPEELYFDAKRAVVLSSGPSASLSSVDRAREEAGLQPVSEILEGENL